MISVAIFALCCLLTNNLKAQHSSDTAASDRLTQKLDDYLISVVRAHRFNGSVLIARHGKILLHKSYGWKNYETHIPNDTSGIYQIASITKTFTAAIILKLQEAGKLSITDKVSKYLPRFPQGNKIKIENLLTHTAGIGNVDVDETDTIAWTPVSQDRMLDAFQNEPLAFQPGTRFSYRNSGYFLLGMIIEKVTGMPYQQVVRKIIFEPLHMIHSGFDFINLVDTSKVTGYTLLTADRQIRAPLIDSTITFASGDIYSTTEDLYSWINAVSRKQILSENSWKNAFTPFKENYGFGLFNTSINNKNCIWHSGATFGFASNLSWFPEEELIIILLDNMFSESNQALLPVETLSAIIFDKPYTLYEEKAEIRVKEDSLNKYNGTYVLSGVPGRTMIISTENGGLVANMQGTILQFVFSTDTDFKFKNLPPDISGQFVIENGRVIKMVISQNGLYEWIKK